MAFHAVGETDESKTRRRERSFNTAVLRLAYERHFGTKDFDDIPEGTAILYRNEGDVRFHLITKISELIDEWAGDGTNQTALLMDWTSFAVSVFHFGPGERGAVQIFDSRAPLSEVLYDIDIDKFIIDFEGNHKC